MDIDRVIIYLHPTFQPPVVTVTQEPFAIERVRILSLYPSPSLFL
jgi:hypothetical protein